MKGLYNIFLAVLILSFSSCFAQNCDTSLTRASIGNPGPYSVSSLTESNGLRNGPDYNGGTVYYPTNATPPFASMVLVPGYLSAASSIQDWGPFLASHGIVTMIIGTNSIFEYPESRATALLDAVVSLRQENTRILSPLFGKLDTVRVGLGGWSMGGGGAQLAAVIDTSFKALLTLCPWLDNTQLNAAYLNHPVPLIIFSGQSDPTAPPATHANLHYSYTPATTSKLLFEITNANHFVANTPTGGQGDIGRLAIPWLKLHLLQDSCYCPLLVDTPAVASKFLYNVVCPAPPPTPTAVYNTNLEKNLIAKFYPNPAREALNLQLNNFSQELTYELFSLAGVKMGAGILSNEINSIPIEYLAKGLYILRVSNANKSETIKFSVF